MRIAVIGGGVSGLSAAAYLAQNGHQVCVYEKNGDLGGRARQIKTNEGYVFDMGPSWYWMPDVFERFFSDFGFAVSDLYDLKRLEPAFTMILGEKKRWHVPGKIDGVKALFEQVETGAGLQLTRFMKDARYAYEVGMGRLVYKPGLSWREFADFRLLREALRMPIVRSFRAHVYRYFQDPDLRRLMEFPVLFLGARPRDTAALYSLMNYAGLALGTWYPMGGFGQVIAAMKRVGFSMGVTYRCSAPVERICVARGLAMGVIVNGRIEKADAVIASADYHHTESDLLDQDLRNYTKSYWDSRILAPSALIYYVGVSRRIGNLAHHTLFFDADFETHAHTIFEQPDWPQDPLFYVCCPSRTDPSVAPPGHENLFFLMPLAPGLKDDESTRERYFTIMLQRLERETGQQIAPHIDYKKSYCVNDFVSDYHSLRGNAYGLANTLKQTALWRPKITNSRVRNLFYTGHLTVPGPGVPPALISGKVAATELLNRCKIHT